MNQELQTRIIRFGLDWISVSLREADDVGDDADDVEKTLWLQNADPLWEDIELLQSVTHDGSYGR